MLQQTQLLGTWSLESWRVSVGAEQREPPVGPGASGQLCYLPDGGMSAILVGRGTGMTRLDPDDSEIALIRATGCIAYAGRFEIRGWEVHHHVSDSLVPAWKGQTLVRLARLPEPQRLVLATPAAQNRSGQEIVNQIVWRRACPE